LTNRLAKYLLILRHGVVFPRDKRPGAHISSSVGIFAVSLSPPGVNAVGREKTHARQWKRFYARNKNIVK
jgi:hypothetical protein